MANLFTEKMLSRLLHGRYARANRRYLGLLKRLFDITPSNLELYKLALVHKSASVSLDNGGTVNNERLEFLGDAVLQTIVSEMLFIEFPEKNEGFLSKIRSRIVSRNTLNRIALDLGLDQEIVAHASNVGSSRNNIYGDALEAMIGALYLDKGYNTANRVVIDQIFGRYLDLETMIQTEKDFKSRIIEWSQKQKMKVQFRSQECADHIDLSPHFECYLSIGEHVRGYGDGRSKKEAEQNAALQAYQECLSGEVFQPQARDE